VSVEVAVEQAHRRCWGSVLASTARLLGDLDLAQEVSQDAFVAALETWGVRGVPDNPDAWLTTTARRRALDLLRRQATLRRKLPLLVADLDDDAGAGQRIEPEEGGAVRDELLRLVFACCHPALSRDAQVSLTLRLVCGVPTREVAAALLVPEPTVAARITRAKKKITAAAIPYRVPRDADLPVRLDAVLGVVYLAFTLGHTAPGGERVDDAALVERAVHLARALVELMPDEPEARGLLGLVLLTHARRGARVDGQGRLVLLEQQDRSRWDAAMVADGLAWTRSAMAPRPGRFALQAAVAACHAAAPTWQDTPWREVVRLHDLLLEAWPSPVVRLNRAAALSYADGPAPALAEVDAVAGDQRLAGYHYLPAARAELLHRLGRHDEAADELARAIALCRNASELDHLTRRLASVRQGVAGPPR